MKIIIIVNIFTNQAIPKTSDFALTQTGIFFFFGGGGGGGGGIVKSSQVTFIYIALLTIQIVTKQLHNIKMGK